MQIGDPIGDVRATLRTIALAWLPLIPTVLLLSSSGGWLMARRALAPMRSITATLDEIQADDQQAGRQAARRHETRVVSV